MKTLLVVLFVTFQTIISSTVLAWSPLDGVGSANDSVRHCYWVVASSEEEQEDENNEEEEEEPDCD